MRLAGPLALLLALTLTACAQSDYEDPDALIRDTTAVDAEPVLPSVDLMEAMEADQRFSTFVTAVDSAGLRSTFDSPAPLTIFAPTNEAFGALEEGALEDLLGENRRDELRDLIMQHVINGRRLSADLRGVENVESMYGSDLRVRATESRVRIDNAEVTEADIEASNGVIHAINRVLTPPEQI